MRWAEEDSEHYSILARQGFEPIIRRWVQDEFWAVLMVRIENY